MLNTNNFSIYKKAPSGVFLPSPGARAHPYIRIFPPPSTSAQPLTVNNNLQIIRPVIGMPKTVSRLFKRGPNGALLLLSPENSANPDVRVVVSPSISAQRPIVSHNLPNILPGRPGDAAAGLLKLQRPEHHEDSLYKKLNDKVDKLSDKLDDMKDQLDRAVALLAKISQKVDNNNDEVAEPVLLEQH